MLQVHGVGLGVHEDAAVALQSKNTKKHDPQTTGGAIYCS